MKTTDADVRWFCKNETCPRFKIETAHDEIDLDKNPGFNCDECGGVLNTKTYVTATDNIAANQSHRDKDTE